MLWRLSQTSGLVTIDYNNGALKNRLTTKSGHQNPAQQLRYVLNGLPRSTDCSEVIAGLRVNGVDISHAR